VIHNIEIMKALLGAKSTFHLRLGAPQRQLPIADVKRGLEACAFANRLVICSDKSGGTSYHPYAMRFPRNTASPVGL
jgi:hypothetical protein